MASDFTFDSGSDPELETLTPLYTHILGPKAPKPTVSLGAVSLAAAEAWFTKQHERYRGAVGERSRLLYTMAILDRITIHDTI